MSYRTEELLDRLSESELDREALEEENAELRCKLEDLENEYGVLSARLLEAELHLSPVSAVGVVVSEPHAFELPIRTTPTTCTY